MKNNHILFEAETKIKIGKTTYILSAHFDDTREPLKKKINHLLSSEIENIIKRQHWQSQRNVIQYSCK